MFGSVWLKTSHDTFSGFDAAHKYDGMTKTDRQTDRTDVALAYTSLACM